MGHYSIIKKINKFFAEDFSSFDVEVTEKKEYLSPAAFISYIPKRKEVVFHTFLRTTGVVRMVIIDKSPTLVLKKFEDMYSEVNERVIEDMKLKVKESAGNIEKKDNASLYAGIFLIEVCYDEQRP